MINKNVANIFEAISWYLNIIFRLTQIGKFQLCKFDMIGC